MSELENASRDGTSVVPAVSFSVPDESSRRSSWRVRLLKCAVSAWLVYHLAGLILAPATVPPTPMVLRESYAVFRPYLEFLNFNQGNHFFAPDPGVSTLVAYTIEREHGSEIVGRMPDRITQPRLMYHRHFMLTESLGNLDYVPEARQLLIRALARQLLREHQGQAISLSRITHELPGTEQVLNGTPLDAPESYIEEPIGRFEWRDFSP